MKLAKTVDVKWSGVCRALPKRERSFPAGVSRGDAMEDAGERELAIARKGGTKDVLRCFATA
jgi:hypothetical protein